MFTSISTFVINFNKDLKLATAKKLVNEGLDKKLSEYSSELERVSRDVVDLEMKYAELHRKYYSTPNIRMAVKNSLKKDIKVNGEICTSRGKKLRDGDSFEFQRVIYNILKKD